MSLVIVLLRAIAVKICLTFMLLRQPTCRSCSWKIYFDCKDPLRLLIYSIEMMVAAAVHVGWCAFQVEG